MSNRLVVFALFLCTLASNAAEFFPTGSTWRFLRGTNEASSPDITLWRTTNGFSDAAFANAPAPFWYGDVRTGGTQLNDMLNNYSCFFLRKEFVVTNLSEFCALQMTYFIDDGLVAWINGVEVLRVNMNGGDVNYLTLALNQPVDPAVLVSSSIGGVASFLREGTNLIVVQVFNTSLASSDLGFDLSLSTLTGETNAPSIVSVNPAPGTVTSLTQVTVTFSEAVQGVGVGDLLLNNDQPATGVSGSGSNYTFTFSQPAYGNVSITWLPGHGITDTGLCVNPFNATGAGATWSYTLQDIVSPTVVNLFPQAGLTLHQLSQVEVTFSEEVNGVNAADLLINSQPATSVTRLPGGPYIFQFPSQPAGAVSVQWAGGHGIADQAIPPNAFVPNTWSYTVDPNAVAGDVVINEILADNLSGLTDVVATPEDPDPLPWIELRNRGAAPVNLLGWSLSDDNELPGQWVFPSKTLQPGEYLIVFASGLDIRNPSGTNRFHTNFKLSRGGEFLGLYNGDSPRALVSAFNPKYPAQRPDYSFGPDTQGNLRYFAPPTPGGPNGTSTITGVVEPVHFSSGRGHYTQPFDLLLTSPTPGAFIRYTLDGTVPGSTTGTLYTGPVRISNNAFFRAAAFRANLLPSTVGTHSYLFNQSATVRSMPVLSLVTAVTNMVGRYGILGMGGGSRAGDNLYITNNPATDYHNPSAHGIAWEKPVSAELIYPADNSGFQIDCGIRVQGSDWQRPRTLSTHKFSYRLYYRSDYGAGKLEEKLFPLSSVESFDQTVVRAGFNDANNPFIRDELTRRISHDMGQVASHGTFWNVFTNGGYAGYFNPTERVHEEFFRSYLGGGPEWDVVGPNFATGAPGTPLGVIDGDRNDFANLMTNVWNGSLLPVTTAARYTAIGKRVELVNFADYCLLNAYAAMGDWPANNWRAGRERATNALWRFVIWDGEWANGFDTKTSTYDTFAQTGSGTLDAGLNSTGNSEIARLYQGLVRNPEFRLLWADRIHKHFFNGGALTSSNVNTRLQEMRTTLASHFTITDTKFLNWPVDRLAPLMGQFNTYGLYGLSNATHGFFASSNAPILSQHGGRVAPGYVLTMNAPLGGSIYYTTNGSDPRVPFTGAVSNSAVLYTGAVVLAGSQAIKARTLLFGTNWSAAADVVFDVGTLGIPLRVTEIMYNPPGGSIHEYVELLNIGGAPLDLGGMYFSDGIEYTFGQGATLAAGARLVLANNTSPAAFAAQYPGVAVFGYFNGNLNNAGERVTLRTPGGAIVFSVDYDDEGGWPTAPDGFGRSLEIIDVYGGADDPANWRASSANGGSPGAAPAPVAPASIIINELLAVNVAAVNNAGTFPDFVELHNPGGALVNLAGWSLTDDGNARKFVFPSVNLPAGGYLTVWCDALTNTSPGLHTGFTLDASGKSVFLYDPATNRVDAISLGLQIADYSVGRVAGQWVLTTPTTNAPNVAAATAPQSSLSINEWIANSLPGQSDWLELYNTAALPVSLKGVYLSITNEVSQLTALSFVAPFGFAQIFADELVGPAHVDFKLPAAGTFIALSDATAIEVNRVTYTAAVEGLSRGRLPDGTATFVNFTGSASPGAGNYVISYNGPVLNEVLARNQSAVTNGGRVMDYLELFNASGSPFPLAGMSLSVGQAEPGQWVFPAGASIAGGGYLVIWCDGDLPASFTPGSFNTGRSLAGESGGAYLFNAAGQVVNSVDYGFQVADKSIGLSGGQWRLLNAPTPGAINSAVATLGASTGLRINEWMAAPASGADWFELFNINTLPVDLAGLILTDDPSYAGTNRHRIAPLSFIGPRGFTRWIADNDPEQGRDHASFSLDAGGEFLRIYAANGTTILDTVAFGAQWLGISQGLLPDGSATVESFPGSASPGEANYVLAGLLISEILTHAALPLEDAVEIRNPGTTTVNIGGWFLSDSQNDFKKYRVADGTLIPPGGFLVLYETQFNAGPSAFSLNAAYGGEVWLSAADPSGNLTGLRAGASYGSQRSGVSFGRYVTSVGVDYPALSARTFGQDNPASVAQFRTGLGEANAAPAMGPVIINEIHYNPAPGAGSGDEFVELLNLTGATVQLFDPAAATNRWRLRDAVEFTFPLGTTLTGNQFAVVVNFDPANTVALDAFRARHGVSPGVPVFGPFIGQLNNGGDSVELVRPDSPLPPGSPAAGFVPRVLVDKVAYTDSTPWPFGAVDGGGLSLQRKAPGLYGNEPVNWVASTPTPGLTNGAGVLPPPVITLQPQPATLTEGAVAALSVAASGGGSLQYQWRQNGLSLPGATGTVFAINYAVGENAGLYDVIVGNAGGSALSTGAVVRVAIPPSVLIAPTNVPARPGSNAVFTVFAGGEKPLSYQWRRNGVLLPGETAATLIKTNVQLADDADYEVTIMNPAGSAAVTAHLFILINPVFTLVPLSQQVPVNSQVTLSVAYTGNPAPFSVEWRRSSTPLTTNVVSGLQDFFTFTATNIPTTVQYRAVVRNLAIPSGVASAFANIVTLADTDGDGIPDAWEQQFGLNPNSAADRNTDGDGDGASNWAEFTAGTHPGDSNSFLRVSLQVVGTPSVEFGAVSNRTYTVQYAEALGLPWQRLANVLARANNRVETIPDPAWTTNRFYRLVTPWQP